MKPKPSLLNYDRDRYEAWKRDTLIWCAETMAEAADTMERCMLDRPTPQPPKPTLIERLEQKVVDRWLKRATLGAQLRHWMGERP